MYKYLFFIATLSIFCPIRTYAQWTEVEGITNQIIYDVSFADNDDGWAVGLNGIMLHFDGITWSEAPKVTNNNFNRICFTSHSEGWAITGNGEIFRYDGEEWSLNFAASQGLYTLYFLDTGEGFVSGLNGFLAFYDGDQWIEGNIGFNVLTLSAYFANNKNGWLSGGAGEMYQFKDSVWSKVDIASTGAFFEMAFTAPDNGYGVGFDNTIWRYDGNDWSLEHTSVSNPSQYLTDVYFLDEDHGWAAGQGTLFTYSLGTWQETTIPPDWEIWGFHFEDPFKGWAVGSSGLLIEQNEKLSWREIDEIPNSWYITAMDKSSTGVLFALGHTENKLISESEACLYLSSNGLSWEKVNSTLDELARTNTILVTNDVILVSGMDREFNNLMLRSTDQGQHWETISAGLTDQTSIVGLTATEGGTLYATAKHTIPELYKSEDMGLSWTLVTTSGFSIPSDPFDANYISIAAIDNQLFIYHQDQENDVYALYSSDNGTDWMPIPNYPEAFFIVDLYSDNEGKLYAAGAVLKNEAIATIAISSDLGNSWSLIDGGNMADIYVSILKMEDDILVSAYNGGAVPTFEQFTTLRPSTQTINFNQLADAVYGDAPLNLEGSSTSGLPIHYVSSNSDVAEINGDQIIFNGAGNAIISATQVGNGAFEPAETVEQDIQVNKATLSIMVEDASRLAGEPNPEFVLTYEGWVGDDGIEDINQAPTASTIADELSVPGTYPISISGGNDENYTFNFQEGTLSINAITGLRSGKNANIELYPNPAKDQVSIKNWNDSQQVHISIHHANGILIEKFKCNHSNFDINVGQYPPGIYFIMLKSDGGVQVLEFIKQ